MTEQKAAVDTLRREIHKNAFLVLWDVASGLQNSSLFAVRGALDDLLDNPIRSRVDEAIKAELARQVQ